MLSKNAKVDAIRGVPLFAACSKSELAAIAAVADEVSFEEGRTLIREGEPGREFVVVLDGDVEVRRRGRKVPLRGDDLFFGEIALLVGTPRNATITTTSRVRALVIGDRAFHRLLRESPRLRAKIMTALAERLAPTAL